MNIYYNTYARVRQGGILLLFLIALLMSAAGLHAQNALSVPAFGGQADKTVYVPVYLDNADEVVSVQFDAVLPFDMPEGASALPTNRANGHSVSTYARGSHVYRVVMMQMQNNALRGNSGLLLRLPMVPVDNLNTDNTDYPLTLRNIVLADATGKNLATVSELETTFTIERGPMPDITVESVEPVTTSANPGDVVSVSYTVKNEGTGNTLAGWTERFYLESAITGNRIFLGSRQHGSTLNAGASYSSTADFQLAQLPHADGPQVVVLELTPAEGMGELLSAQGNNNGRSSGVLNLSKRLSLYYNKTTLSEYTWYAAYYTHYDYITLSVQRSGDWTLAETMLVTCDVDGLLTLDGNVLYSNTATTVRIPAWQAGVTMRLRSVDDLIRRTDRATVTITPQNPNSGYETQTLTISRTDDDRDPLTLTASSQQITEGQLVTLTVQRGGELAEDVDIAVACSQQGRFSSAPYVIHIAKGQTTGSLTIESIDDNTPQLDCIARFTASAKGCQTASADVLLYDNDRPQISLTVAPATVCENAGSQAVVATITRDRGLDQSATVWLSSSDSKAAFFQRQQVQIPAGERQVQVAVGVADNSDVDGTRSYSLTAAFYVAANQQVVGSYDRAYSSASLTVTDDEEPYLTMSPNSVTRNEGSSVSFTVTRYVVSASADQTVLLSCSNPDDVSMPTSVTIPANSVSASFTVGIKRNTTEDDDRTLTIEAQADGLNGAQAVLNISDRTLPDAVNPEVAITTPVYSGMEATLSATIGNTGTAPLPAGVQIDFYLSADPSVSYYTTLYHIATMPTTEPVDIDGEKTFSCTTVMPQLTGNYYLYAQLNSDHAVSEFSTQNNRTPQFRRVTIQAPYALKTLETDKDTYLPNEEVRVTGRVVSLLPGGLKGQQVSLSLTGNGQSLTQQTVAIDEQTGAFEAYLRISSTATGMLSVIANAVGQTDAALLKQVGVYAISLSVDECTSRTITGSGAISGKLRLRNNSGYAVSGIAIGQPTTLPAGCQLTLSCNGQTLPGTLPGALAAGSSLYLDFSCEVAEETGIGSHTIGFTAKTAEGANASSQLVLSHYEAKSVIEPDPYSDVVFENGRIETTLLVGGTRELWVPIVNKGGLETGEIALSTSGGEWLQSLTASPMPSVKGNNGKGWIHLMLTHLPGMHSGETYEGRIAITPQNGNACSLPIRVRITGIEWSKLDVTATDVYTLANQDFSHVSGATLTVSNAATGREVLTGTIGNDGHWTTDHIEQGTYSVTVKAPRHKGVTHTLVIGPDEERQMTFFLPYQAVLAEFVTSQSLEDGSYKMTSTFDVDYNAPQAIVLAELPEDGFGCGTEEIDIKLTNVGMREATDVMLLLPQVAGVTFSIANDEPLTLAPNGGTGIVQVTYEGGDESLRRRVIAKSLMHYSFQIDGQVYSENDYYQSLVGCFTPGRPEPQPIVDTTDPNPDDPSYDPTNPDGPGKGDNYYYPGTEDTKKKDGEGTKNALPSKNSYFQLVFDDVEQVVTGEPFYATLTVKNGQEGNFNYVDYMAMASDDGDDVWADYAYLFNVEQGEVTGFTRGANGLLTLPGNTVGTMRLTFTPLPEAAADGDHTYYVGGMLNYTNAADEIHHSATLAQQKIVVGARGELTIIPIAQRYFPGQGGIAQMATMVQNTGTMSVNRIRLNNRQPVVRDLSTFLPVSYSNEAQSLPEGVTGDFSSHTITTIEGGQTLTSRWLYKSEEDGKVDAFEQLAQTLQTNSDTYSKVTVDNVRELFRTVKDMDTQEETVDETDLSDVQLLTAADVMLVVENEREVTTPDRVLYSDGTDGGAIADVSKTTAISGAGSEYNVTVTADEAGWVYGKLHDPTNGVMLLQKVVRQSDGKTISLANFWQTDRTLQSDLTYIEENLLHFADKMAAKSETYKLTYVQREGTDLQLMNVRLYTADGTLVENGGTTTERVVRAVVDFTGSINKVALSALQFTARETAWNNANTVTSTYNQLKDVCTLDLSQMDEVPGLHTMTVIPKKIRIDRKNYLTGDDVVVKWTEQLQGTAQLDLAVAPEAAFGTIDHESGDYPYGMLTLTATPAEGYQFDYWSIDGKKIADSEPVLSYDVWKDASIRAYFSARRCMITVDVDDEGMGELSQGTLGTVPYDWGYELSLAARAKRGYEFSHWLLNGEIMDDANWQMTVRVTDDATYTAVFREKTIAGALLTDQNGWIYQVNADVTTVTLINAHDTNPLPAGDVTVPATATLNDREYQVTGVGGDANQALAAGAFSGCTGITTLTLEGKLAMNIERRALDGCDQLVAINVDYVAMNGYLKNEQIAEEIVQLLRPFVDVAKELTTFACAAGIDFGQTEGINAFVATSYNDAEGSVRLSPVDEVPAGEGVVLSCTPGTRYYLQPADIINKPAKNMLVGAVEATDLTTTQGDMTIFLLKNGQFGKSANGRLAAGKAYLAVPTSELSDATNDARGIVLEFGEAPSGISKIGCNESQKDWYMLDGRRIGDSPLRKGIYLQKGKKVTMK